MARKILIRTGKILFWILLFVLAVAGALEVNLLGGFGSSPSKQEILNPLQSKVTEIYTKDSVLLGRLFKEDRSPVQFSEISPILIEALIATEDIRFYKHPGVDFVALASSMLSTAQGDRRGGSTISQQLAKNLYKTRFDSQSGWFNKIPGLGVLSVKFKEWITALKLEANYSKNEILAMYLNTVSFGNNAYGIRAASKRYFGKEPADVTVVEAATLIGLLKGTSYYNPMRFPDRALERRNVVLLQMSKAGYLTADSLTFASERPLGLYVDGENNRISEDSYLRRAVEKWLLPWAEERGIDLYEAGYTIYTTIDSRVQQHAEEAMSEQMKILQRRLENSWAGEQPWRDSEQNVIPDFLENLAKKTAAYKGLSEKFESQPDSVWHYLQKKKKMTVFSWNGPREVQYSTMDSLKHYAMMLNIGFVSMDPFDGSIRAWIGGIDFEHFQFDHVMQAKRQPGSTFKTFAYLAALESGMTPCDQFIDKPVHIQFEGEDGEEIWSPKNADWTFSGMNMSLRWAMARSINSITAQITEKVGWDKVVEAANRSGIKSKLRSVPSVSLGSSEVNVLEMVNAYSTFMNQGKRVEPRLISHILDADQKEIYRSEAVAEQVIDPEVAWLMTYMLRGAMDEPGGTSQGLWEWDLFRKGNHIGGKTGTSSDYVDSWYMGLTKDLVTGIWIGCDEQSIHFRNSQTGEASRTALPVFGRYMEKLYKDKSLSYDYGSFPEPSGEIKRKYKCPTLYVAPIDTIPSPELLLPDPGIQLPDIVVN